MKKKLLFALFALFLLSNATFAKSLKVLFIDQSTNFGVNSQSGIVDALTAAGHIVTTLDLANPIVTTGLIDFASLETYDLIVVSKACNSTHFQYSIVGTNWEAITKPVIFLSPYMVKSDRLNYVSFTTLTLFTTKTDFSTICKGIPNPTMATDPVFTGVTTAGAAFEYYKGYYEGFGATPDASNNGKVLVSLNSDATLGAGFPIAIRWSKGLTYSGGSNNASARTYLGIGSDNGKLGNNYNNFTPQSLKFFMNEVTLITGGTISDINSVRTVSNTVSVVNRSVKLLEDVNSLEVFNVLGSSVLVRNNLSAGTSITLDKAGVYLIKARVGNSLVTQKIVLN